MKEPASSYEAPPKGEPLQVVLADIFVIGQIESKVSPKFKKKPTDPDYVTKEKVRVVLQTAERNAAGFRFTISGDYTYSTSKKAAVIDLLSQWLGGKFTSFSDVEAQVGTLNGLLTISWGGENETYANIGAITALPKAIPQIVLEDYKRRSVYLKAWERLVEKADGVDYANAGGREPGDEDQDDTYAKAS